MFRFFFSNSTFVIIFKQQSPETKHDILYKILHFSVAGFPMCLGVFGAANVFFFSLPLFWSLSTGDFKPWKRVHKSALKTQLDRYRWSPLLFGAKNASLWDGIHLRDFVVVVVVAVVVVVVAVVAVVVSATTQDFAFFGRNKWC